MIGHLLLPDRPLGGLRHPPSVTRAVHSLVGSPHGLYRGISHPSITPTSAAHEPRSTAVHTIHELAQPRPAGPISWTHGRIANRTKTSPRRAIAVGLGLAKDEPGRLIGNYTEVVDTCASTRTFRQ